MLGFNSDALDIMLGKIARDECTEILREELDKDGNKWIIRILLVQHWLVACTTKNGVIESLKKFESLKELKKLFKHKNIGLRIKDACMKEVTRFALHNTYDGDHHKMWVIDQILRIVNLDDYDSIIKKHSEEYGWDNGIAP